MRRSGWHMIPALQNAWDVLRRVNGRKRSVGREKMVRASVMMAGLALSAVTLTACAVTAGAVQEAPAAAQSEAHSVDSERTRQIDPSKLDLGRPYIGRPISDAISLIPPPPAEGSPDSPAPGGAAATADAAASPGTHGPGPIAAQAAPPAAGCGVQRGHGRVCQVPKCLRCICELPNTLES